MVAKAKKKKEETIIEEEKVIEVKTTKEDTDKPAEEKDKKEKTTDLGKETISSFSQLDSDKKPSTEEKEEEPEIKVEKEEAKEEETTLKETPKEEPKEQKEEKAPIDTKEWIPSTDEEVEEKAPKSKLLVFFIIFIIIGVIVGGFFYYRSSMKSKTTEEPSTTPETAEVTPTPTQIPEESVEEVDYSEYSVSVLNGSGIPGEAGTVQELLEELGLKDIDTGNAESYDYETTEVSFKDSVPSSVFNDIEETLGGEYTVELTESTLDEDSSFDIIIIVGVKK